LFVYKSIFYLEKNELTFDSRKELMKNGFLQLALYLHRKKIKHYKFKLKNQHNISISYSNSHKKKKIFWDQFAAFRSIIKENSKKYSKIFKKRVLGLDAKHFAVKLRGLAKSYTFSRSIKNRPSIKKIKNIIKKELILESYQKPLS